MSGAETSLCTPCTSEKMAKKITEYELILVDMDGTLYYQRPLQIVMGCRMMSSALTDKGGLKELMTVLKYRKMRDAFDGKGNVDDTLYEQLAEGSKMPKEQMKQIIEKWIYKLPLENLPAFRDEKLYQVIGRLGKIQIPVVIWSDYPPDEKKDVLGLSDVPGCYNGQKEIAALKPSPDGIRYLMKEYGILDAGEVLVIGDRLSKDGAAAMAAGADYIILKKHPWQRKRQYKKLLWEF